MFFIGLKCLFTFTNILLSSKTTAFVKAFGKQLTLVVSDEDIAMTIVNRKDISKMT